MDCVACVVMGMCMLCTPDMGASEAGRPMTREEVDQAVALVVGQFRVARQQEENDRKQREVQQNRRDLYERRQSFFDDPRYSNMGIGKRNVMDNSDSTKRLPELRSRHVVLKLQRFPTPNALDAQTLFPPSSNYAKLTGLPLITLLGIRIEGSEKPDSNRKSSGTKSDRHGTKRHIDKNRFKAQIGKRMLGQIDELKYNGQISRSMSLK